MDFQKISICEDKINTSCSDFSEIACKANSTPWLSNVLLIDLDPKSDVGLHLGLPWEHDSGWSNYPNFESGIEEFFTDNDGVIFLPFGSDSSAIERLQETILGASNLKTSQNSWVIFDCPSYAELNNLPVTEQDIILEVINCDAICHNLIYKRLFSLKQMEKSWRHYFLINNYNSASELESDLLQVWQSETPLFAPVHINKDEVIKESTAFKNVAINCAPYSVAYDDFETLAGWLVSKANKND